VVGQNDLTVIRVLSETLKNASNARALVVQVRRGPIHRVGMAIVIRRRRQPYNPDLWT
jgi:hypothetical protein